MWWGTPALLLRVSATIWDGFRQIDYGDAAATAAFAIAAVALWASNLKRADVRLYPVPEIAPSLGSTGWSGAVPTDVRIVAVIYGYNSGARGGLLSTAQAEFKEDKGETAFAAGAQYFQPAGGPGLPQAFEAGDVHRFTLEFRVTPTATGPTDVEILRSLMAMLEPKNKITVLINYSFVKGSSLKPWRRGRPVSRRRRLRFEVPLADFKTRCREVGAQYGI